MALSLEQRTEIIGMIAHAQEEVHARASGEVTTGQEGLRTITLTSSLYAVWNRSQNVVRDWEMEILKEFDTCKPGFSALLAALGRPLRAEVANLLQQKVGGFSTITVFCRFDGYRNFARRGYTCFVASGAYGLRHPTACRAEDN